MTLRAAARLFSFPLFLAVLLPSCAKRPHVRHEAPTPPVLVEWRRTVLEEEVRAARERVAGREPSPRTLEAFTILADDAFNRGDFSTALEGFTRLRDFLPPSEVPQRVRYMVGQSHFERGEPLPALSAYQKVVEADPGSEWARQAERMMDFIVRYVLDTRTLTQFVENYPHSPARCTALFEIGRREAREGLRGRALEALLAYREACPTHSDAADAEMLLQEVRREKQGKAWHVAVLAPLSGPYRAFGEAVSRGVSLVFEEEGKDPVVLTVRDTQGDPLRAVHLFRALVADPGLDVLVGPVLPSEIASVAPLADLERVVLITPAAGREGVASLGEWLFRNSMTNEMQGRAMARFAWEELGLSSFAVLHPDDAYGRTLADAFASEVEALGATLVARVAYPPGATDFKAQLLELGGLHPTEAKENERENDRLLQEMRFRLSRETAKALLTLEPATPREDDAVALVPFAEGLTNTAAPSLAADLQRAVEEALRSKASMSVRPVDLVAQALSSVPEEFRGNTRPPDPEVLRDLASEVRARILFTGRVVETDPEGEWHSDPTWNYEVTLEAYAFDPETPEKVRRYRDRRSLHLFKDPALLQKPVGFEALYLPAHAREIPLLASQISFYSLNPVLLGGHLWDGPEALREAGSYTEGAYLVTGFFAASNRPEVRHFVKRYEERYAAPPDLLAAQAFDAARMVKRALEKAGSREEVRENLRAIENFPGVSGLTTFRGSGEAEKKLSILRIEKGRLVQVQ